MIIFFRNISETWVVKALMFLIAVSMMGLCGLGSMTSMWGRDQTAIRVGNSTVKGQELVQELDKEIRNLSKIYKSENPLTIKQAVNMGMLDKLIESNKNSLLFQTMMDDFELIASDAAVANYIVNNALFQTTTGTFNRSLMMEYLQRMQMSEQQFAHALQEELARKHLTDAVAAVIIPPKMLKEKMYDYMFETRNIDALVLSPESVKITEKPTKEVLQEYYDSMEEQLYAPEYRKISILKMTPEKIAKNVEINEDTLKEMYEERKEVFLKPEQRHVEQILFNNEADANALYAELTADNFNDLAKEKANQTNTDLGWIEKTGVVEEIGEAAFNAEVGKVLPPVQTVFGYHIIIVREVKAAEQTTFEQAKENLIKTIQSENTYDLLTQKAKQLDELLGEGISLAEAAKKVGVELEEAVYIDASGADKQGKSAELPAALVQELFLSKAGEATALHDYQNGFIVAETTEIESTYLKPFDAVQDELKAEWVKDQQKNAIADFAEKVFTGAKNDKLLKTVATVYNLEQKEWEDVKRADIDDISSDDIEKLFNAKEGEIQLIELPDNHYIVAQVKKITPAEKTDVSAQMSLTIDLKQKMTACVMDELLDYYGKKEKVEVNQAVIDEAFKPYMEAKE
ncbi:MAG: peptidyl-prolyl cis-trans isomerase [Alphaproteobacteria bacterium]|nr:peptidyl-prolyl cis-trans isomerase [Alphaproteobacteria bacterium]